MCPDTKYTNVRDNVVRFVDNIAIFIGNNNNRLLIELIGRFEIIVFITRILNHVCFVETERGPFYCVSCATPNNLILYSCPRGQMLSLFSDIYLFP